MQVCLIMGMNWIREVHLHWQGEGKADRRLSSVQNRSTNSGINNVAIQSNRNRKSRFFFELFMRMLYSCLVDADFLDTEDFMKAGKTQREAGENLTTLLQKLEKHVEDWLKIRKQSQLMEEERKF